VSYLTGRPLWFSGARMLLIGALAAGITYGVGTLLDVAVS
jgi:VIT1/CCC1 family predicted Fe2+/Mn2+ transporter